MKAAGRKQNVIKNQRLSSTSVLKYMSASFVYGQVVRCWVSQNLQPLGVYVADPWQGISLTIIQEFNVRLMLAVAHCLPCFNTPVFYVLAP